VCVCVCRYVTSYEFVFVCVCVPHVRGPACWLTCRHFSFSMQRVAPPAFALVCVHVCVCVCTYELSCTTLFPNMYACVVSPSHPATCGVGGA
jgi:hypothetical protein